MKVMEATKAAGDFTKLLDQVYLHQECFKIVKKGIPCAYLVPVLDRTSDSHAFAQDLAEADLPAEERRAFAAAIRNGRKGLKAIKNPWG